MKSLPVIREHMLHDEAYGAYVQAVKPAVAMFGITYRCEQMKHTKSRLRSQLTDRHLNDILLLSASSISPNIPRLVAAEVQHKPSH